MAAADFEADLERAITDVTAARLALLAIVEPLSGDDLDRSIEGEWPVHRILAHILEYERMYMVGIESIRDHSLSSMTKPSLEGLKAIEIVRHLAFSHSEMLAAVEGITREDLCKVKRLGEFDFSVLGLLQKTAEHDREHADQLSAALDG